MNKYEKLYTEAAAGGKNPSWLDTAVRPLAADIGEATGHTTEREEYPRPVNSSTTQRRYRKC